MSELKEIDVCDLDTNERVILFADDDGIIRIPKLTNYHVDSRLPDNYELRMTPNKEFPFEIGLKDRTLSEDLDALRAIPAKWKQLADPLAAVQKIRDGEDWDLDEQLASEQSKKKYEQE